MRVALKWISLIVAFFAFPAVMVAQESMIVDAQADARYQQLRVVVLPMRDYREDESRLFFVENQKDRMEEESSFLSRLQGTLDASLASSSKLNVVSRKKTLSRPPFKAGYERGVELVRDRYHLARDLYDDLRLEEAEEGVLILLFKTVSCYTYMNVLPEE